MASRSGTFIFTWLKISIIVSICAFFLFFFNLSGNGNIGLYTWLADLSLSDSSDWDEMELGEVDGCVVVLNGIGWQRHLIINFLSWLNVWTTLHWLNYWSLAWWTWLEFLGIVTVWLGNILLGLSLYELASWLIWTSSLVMAWALLFCNVCMSDSWFLIFLSIVFSKSVILFSSGGLWKEDCGAWLGKFCW